MKRPVVWARAALDDVKQQLAHIGADHPAAARRVAARIGEAGEALGVFATGRPGRVTGTYEKALGGLPYIISYALRSISGRETVVILRVIHMARDWPSEDWPD